MFQLISDFVFSNFTWLIKIGRKLSYTFFAPTATAFFRQMPQDTVDPLNVDENLRTKVLIRHFARQRVSASDLDKLEKLVMADSNEAILTRTPGKSHPFDRCVHALRHPRAYVWLLSYFSFPILFTGTQFNVINKAEIQPGAIQLPNNIGTIYTVDRVFMTGEEVSQAISAHFERNPNTGFPFFG